VAAGAAALFATGCVRSQPAPGLLGARSLVPAPFVEPATTYPGAALPAEPTFPAATTIVPTGATLDENLVLQPADEEEVKPVKSSSGKSVAPAKAEGELLTYTVKKDDSLWLIARMYGVSVAELTAENSIRESKVLKIGQVLTLPRGARLREVSEVRHTTPKHTAAVTPSKPKPTAASKTSASPTKHPAAATSGGARKTSAKEPVPADGMYTIKSGDNPWDLARKFGVKHEELMQWNNLKTDTVLKVGQKIRLRAGAVEGVAATSTPAAATTPVLAPPEAAAAPGGVLTEATPLTAPPATTPAAGTQTPTAATPGAATPAAAPAAPTAIAAPGATAPGALDLAKKLSHSVTEGETLQIIAEMYGTTVEAIKKENPTVKTDADLQPNLKLMVPYR
jgi:LysM repeat protein